MDHAVIFVGPTVGAEAADVVPCAAVRRPAARGDVYRAVREAPRAILLVDGFFESEPAIFHKEILWALSEGIHVFGAASMGALRAAELEPFGMVGVGAVAAAYRSGRIEADDAVAVLHGPAELGYPLLTHALVDMEATFATADAHGIVDRKTARRLTQIARSMFWKERTYEAVLGRAALPNTAAAALSSWLAGHLVSRKAEDAKELFGYVADSWEALEEPFEPSFHFEETVFWRRLVDDSEAEIAGASPQALDAIRAEVGETLWTAAERQALLSLLAEDEARREGAASDDDALDVAAHRFRQSLGLARSCDVADWMASNGIAHPDYESLVRDVFFLGDALRRYRHLLPARIVRLLRSSGRLSAYRTGAARE